MTYYCNATPQPKVLDLFCGAGGLALGFSQAGYRVVGGIDNSPMAIASFDANVARGTGLARDLRVKDFSDITEFLGEDTPDVIVGGPSCQGLVDARLFAVGVVLAQVADQGALSTMPMKARPLMP